MDSIQSLNNALSGCKDSMGINIIEAIIDINENVIQYRAITAALVNFDQT